MLIIAYSKCSIRGIFVKVYFRKKGFKLVIEMAEPVKGIFKLNEFFGGQGILPILVFNDLV